MKKKIHILVVVIVLLGSNLSFGSNLSKNLKDIKSTDWFTPTINKLIQLGGIQGYPDGTFKPNSSMTKAEFVKTLVISLGESEASKSNEHWASGYISKAETLKLLKISKIGNVDSPISRLEAAEIVSNTLTYLKEIYELDSDPVSRVSTKGIMTGYPDGSFKGENNLTRAEASTIVIRTIDKEMRTAAIVKIKETVSAHAEILRLVNIERKNAKLQPMVICSELTKVAELKSKDMAEKNYFDHTSPTYGSPFKMMDQFGILYMAAGENIAKGYKTPEAVVKGWMDSPGHRANILNSSYGKIGIGIYTADVSYWTQMFTN